MFPRLRFSCKLAFSALARSLGVTLLSVLTIGIALAVLATFFVVVSNLSSLAHELGEDVRMSVYLDRGVSTEEAVALAKELESWGVIQSAQFLSPAAAFQDFRTSLGEDAVLLEGLPQDLLPPSIELLLVPGKWTADDTGVLSQRISSRPVVSDVRFGQGDIERVSAFLGFSRIVALVLGAALCFATVLIVSNTIRLTVYARRDEIEIMSLVGATDGFIQAPFVLEGAIQGVLGGALAALGLVALQRILVAGIEDTLSYAFGAISLEFVPLSFLGALLAGGAFLGLLGSTLAVGKFLRV